MLMNNYRSFQNPLPPKDVHFVDLSVEPWEDNLRLKVFVKISEFSDPPNLNFFISDMNDSKISEVTLIENVDKEFVFTMHLRNYSGQRDLLIIGEIFYPDEIGVVNRKTIKINL